MDKRVNNPRHGGARKIMSTITFKPKKITKKIISQLQERSSDVIMNRFGLTADGKRKTLA